MMITLEEVEKVEKLRSEIAGLEDHPEHISGSLAVLRFLRKLSGVAERSKEAILKCFKIPSLQ